MRLNIGAARTVAPAGSSPDDRPIHVGLTAPERRTARRLLLTGFDGRPVTAETLVATARRRPRTSLPSGRTAKEVLALHDGFAKDALIDKTTWLLSSFTPRWLTCWSSLAGRLQASRRNVFAQAPLASPTTLESLPNEILHRVVREVHSLDCRATNQSGAMSRESLPALLSTSRSINARIREPVWALKLSSLPIWHGDAFVEAFDRILACDASASETEVRVCRNGARHPTSERSRAAMAFARSLIDRPAMHISDIAARCLTEFGSRLRQHEFLPADQCRPVIERVEEVIIARAEFPMTWLAYFHGRMHMDVSDESRAAVARIVLRESSQFGASWTIAQLADLASSEFDDLSTAFDPCERFVEKLVLSMPAEPGLDGPFRSWRDQEINAWHRAVSTIENLARRPGTEMSAAAASKLERLISRQSTDFFRDPRYLEGLGNSA